MHSRLLLTLALVTLLSIAAAPLFAGGENRDPRPTEDRFFAVVLGDVERAEYGFMPAEEREEYRRMHWARLDPTPTTGINEREMEHQLRVVRAIRNNRDRFGLFIWDDRARAIIRFGEPSSVRKFIDEGGPLPGEIWSYPDMVLWFEDRRGDDSYRQGFARRGTGAPGIGEELEIRYLDTEARGIPPEKAEFNSRKAVEKAFRAISLDANRGRELALRGAHRWADLPELNDRGLPAGKEIPFLFDVTCFKGAGGGTDVVVGLMAPNGEFAFEGEGRERSARIRRRMALRDSTFEIVAGSEEELVHTVNGDRVETGWLVTADSFAVEPAKYQLVLRLDGRLSGGRNILMTDLVVPRFDGPSIRVSDLAPALRVSTSFREPGLYERRGHRIVPRPARTFTAGEEMHVYFEVYNVTADRDGRYYYSVTYRLEGTEGERGFSIFGGGGRDRGGPGTGQTFSSVGRGPDSGCSIVIDTRDLPPDDYTLQVEVTDQTSRVTDHAEASFRIPELSEGRTE